MDETFDLDSAAAFAFSVFIAPGVMRTAASSCITRGGRGAVSGHDAGR